MESNGQIGRFGKTTSVPEAKRIRTKEERIQRLDGHVNELVTDVGAWSGGFLHGVTLGLLLGVPVTTRFR